MSSHYKVVTFIFGFHCFSVLPSIKDLCLEMPYNYFFELFFCMLINNQMTQLNVKQISSNIDYSSYLLHTLLRVLSELQTVYIVFANK